MIKNYSQDFDITQGQVWLNAASEGPIPKISIAALNQAVKWKSSPELLTIPKFIETPLLLKKSLATLINANVDDIILGNSATYGIHLLSHGLNLEQGDQVIVMQNDFPTDILPWLFLKDKGIDVVQLKAQGNVVTPLEIKQAITVNTKVICLPMVHSFSGGSLDVVSIGNMCREHNIIFIVNMAQVLGVWPVDISQLPIDAIVGAGYKWLLGPYGTGFCWMQESLRQRLRYSQGYWISLLDEQVLQSEGELHLPVNATSRAFDVFGTANFFNFVPWKASIDYLLNIGIHNIKMHSERLAQRIHQQLDLSKFIILSPTLNNITPIVVISHQDKAQNKILHDALKFDGVHTAFWRNTIRISPHVYNTLDDVDRCIEILNLRGKIR